MAAICVSRAPRKMAAWCRRLLETLNNTCCGLPVLGVVMYSIALTIVISCINYHRFFCIVFPLCNGVISGPASEAYVRYLYFKECSKLCFSPALVIDGPPFQFKFRLFHSRNMSRTVSALSSGGVTFLYKSLNTSSINQHFTGYGSVI